MRAEMRPMNASFEAQRDEHMVAVGLAIRASGQQTAVDGLVRRVERELEALKDERPER